VLNEVLITFSFHRIIFISHCRISLLWFEQLLKIFVSFGTLGTQPSMKLVKGYRVLKWLAVTLH